MATVSSSSSRPGQSHTSIKLYGDYDAWLENRFVELGSTFISLNTRDSLTNGSSGLFQIYDTRNLHTKINGREIIQIGIKSSLNDETHNRLYGIKNTSVTVDNKGDNVITFEIAPLHKVKNDKFGRVFYPDAIDTLTEMIRVIYLDMELLMPEITGVGTHIPKVPWMFGIEAFKQFIMDYGLSTEANSFVFAWEDWEGIKVQDYESLIEEEPLEMVFGDPDQIGEFVTQLDAPIVFNFEWLTKNNPYTRDPYENATFLSYSMLDKAAPRIITGDGRNLITSSRSGGYASQLFRNPYEEATRIQTMAQYDSYCKFETFGNLEILPGQKILIYDNKTQFLGYFYVDTVTHSTTMEETRTHIHAFTNSMELKEIENEKLKNTLEDESSESYD